MVQKIINIVKDRTGADPMAKNRKQENVEARRITIYLLHTIMNMSDSDISKIMGIDRTACIHHTKKARNWRRLYPSYKAKLDEYERSFMPDSVEDYLPLSQIVA